MSRPEFVSRSDDLGGKKVDLPDMNSKRDKEREEEKEVVFIVSTEEEQVFIATAKGQNGPKSPYTQRRASKKHLTLGLGSFLSFDFDSLS